MKTYHIIDRRHRDSRSELKHYTFNELKAQFEPSEEEKQDFPEMFGKWQKIQDLLDLVDFLEEQADGMAQPFDFEEDEVASVEAMKRANRFFSTAK